MRSTFLFLLLSCASTYKPPETIGAKMERLNPQAKSFNYVPKAFALDTNYAQFKRRPASEQGQNMVNYSNGSLYFLILYTQLNEVQKFCGHPAHTLKNCPHFHGEFLQVNKVSQGMEGGKINYSLKDKAQLDDPSFLARNPAFLLPLSQDRDSDEIVLNALKKTDLSKANGLIEKALSIHQIKLLSELEELCENGVSDNFYAYQNLIQYTKMANFSASKENMDILLKTTVYFNMALIESLERNSLRPRQRSLSSVKEKTGLENQLNLRLKSQWAESYMKNLEKR
jgi:hypothetical protein